MTTFSTWPGLAFVPWLVFGVIWGAGALSTKRTIQREGIRQMLLYRPPLILGCTLVFTRVGARLVPMLGQPLWPADATSGAIGLAISSAGIGFAIWARMHLGKYWSGAITLKDGHKLIQSGPYGLARHPIYTGITTAALGSAIAVGTVGAAIGLPLIVGSFLFKLEAEERLMAQTFGEEHAQYRARVKRLVPGVW
ncbi:MAG: isoprenylcysteine carboxylmethyltransferase family protein [Deltaproteobacteria bacterium]|nr:isoprenylcysteine carboxylmethyltransferase family protein [Deltaproteobacteria bacterium]